MISKLYHRLPRISPILHFGSFQAQDIRVPARNTSVTNWDPCHAAQRYSDPDPGRFEFKKKALMVSRH